MASTHLAPPLAPVLSFWGPGALAAVSLFLLCPPPKMVTWTRVIPRAWERRAGGISYICLLSEWGQ